MHEEPSKKSLDEQVLMADTVETGKAAEDGVSLPKEVKEVKEAEEEEVAEVVAAELEFVIVFGETEGAGHDSC